MQKTPTSVAGLLGPISDPAGGLRSPAATPSSSIIVASACANAPFWFCSQLAKDADGQGPNPPHDEPLSHEQGTGGFANPLTASLQNVQKTFDLPLPAPVEYEVLVDVPVVKAIGTARAPMSAATVPGGGQSWLVGNAAPRTAEPELACGDSQGA